MKRIWEYAAVFIMAVYACTFLLIISAKIPRDLIQSNMEESAEYLNLHDSHFMHYLIEGVESSIVDEVADANILNIGYYFDASHPLESVMASRWYISGGQNKSFLEAVKEGKDPTYNYLRYWHGSLAFIRPLLLFWNIQEIYRFHIILITVLLVSLLMILFRNMLRFECFALLTAMISISLWTVPWCLEFTWMFLVMFVVSIIAVKQSVKKKEDRFFFMLFFITGMITIYLDFFTTETLTVLIPLLLVLRIRLRQGIEKNWLFSFECCSLWGTGYVGMWVSKWLLASLVLNFNAFESIKGNMKAHLVVEHGMSTIAFLKDVLVRNIRCMFPMSFFPDALPIFFIISAGLFVLLLMKNKPMMKTAGLFLILAFIPYARFIIIRHHSWFHYFFTYRAQAATVMALCFAVIPAKNTFIRDETVISSSLE